MLGVIALCGVLATSAHAQANEVRFPVTSVGDSTVNFQVGANKWVAAGKSGIVVDPKRQDVLIARISILSVRSGTARALITGQTTTVEPGFVAVLERPEPRLFSKRDFWIGTVLGALVGFGLASL
jgi:hypothetical protein